MLNFRDRTGSGVFIAVWTCHDRESFLRVFVPCSPASQKHSLVRPMLSGFVPRKACFGSGTAVCRNCPPPDGLCSVLEDGREPLAGVPRLEGARKAVRVRPKPSKVSCRGAPGEPSGAPGRGSGGAPGPDPSRTTREEGRTSRPTSSKVLGGSLRARLGGTSISAENGFSGGFGGPGGPDTGPPGVVPVGPEVWHASRPNRTLRKATGLRACPCNSEHENSKTALSRAVLAVFRNSRNARRGRVRRGHPSALLLDRSER